MLPNNNEFIYFQLTYPKIVESIRLAAAPPDTQVACFLKSNLPPDEIADIIEHSVMMSKILLKNGFISNHQFEYIESITKKMNDFSKEDWTTDALYQATSWQEIRKLAQKALSALSLEYVTPNLYWFWEQ